MAKAKTGDGLCPPGWGRESTAMFKSVTVAESSGKCWEWGGILQVGLRKHLESTESRAGSGPRREAVGTSDGLQLPSARTRATGRPGQTSIGTSWRECGLGRVELGFNAHRCVLGAEWDVG